MTSLIEIELRKLFDTRASRWAILSGACLSSSIAIIIGVVHRGNLHVSLLLSSTDLIFSLMSSVVGMLGMCADWTHRDAISQWPYVNSRSTLFSAKLIATLISAVSIFISQIVIILLISCAAFALGGHVSFDNVPHRLCFALGISILGVLLGFGISGVVKRLPLAIMVVMFLHLGVNAIAGLALPGSLQGYVSTISPMRIFDRTVPASLSQGVIALLLWYVIPVFVSRQVFIRSEL